jgi:Arc/MetJ family transcription regulator
MSTNLAIDDQLIQAAQKLGQHRTKKEAVNAALDEYVRRRRQQDVLTLFGRVEYKESYNYKKERRSKRK